MKQDRWINTKTQVELGTNGALGSPRAWFRRALDSTNVADMTFEPGSLTGHEISVAGIWYRPCSVPITGMHRELFRFFKVPKPELIVRAAHLVPVMPVIGLCAAVPMHEVMQWIQIYKAHGAAFTWWNAPQDIAVRTAKSVNRRRTDHEQVFALLDAGLTRIAISEQLDLPLPNLDYIAKKWRLKQNV
jgi:hypothetical protein